MKKGMSLKGFVITLILAVAAGTMVFHLFVKEPLGKFLDTWVPKAMAQSQVERKSNVTKVNTIVMVRTLPKEKKAGIYSMVVERNYNGENPLTMEAITVQPTLFRIGDKIEIYSIMPDPDVNITGPHSMYYIAVPLAVTNN
ncbi:MAG: hypothetical protein NTX82_00655 [Candidatus Parcubacteria bacterium]|nr:hypothetical protein [Candidatus Parcubacteria bacterium]